MTITAKFPGKCTCCGGSIRIGEQIEWTKSEGARHVDCDPRKVRAGKPMLRGAPRPKAGRRPSFPVDAPEPGAVMIEGRRDGRGDHRYEVGTTLHAPKVREQGGGPDGHYYTILCAQLRAPNEDNQEFSWHEVAWVRPATDAEAAECAARIAQSERAKTLAAIPAWLVSQARSVEHCTDERIPADAWRLSLRSTLSGSETLYATVDALWYCTSDYDMGPRVWRMPITSDAVAALALAIDMLAHDRIEVVS